MIALHTQYFYDCVYIFNTVPPPEMLIPPENITAAVYTKVTFSCTGRGFGNVRVVWTRPPSKVTDTAVYTTNRYDDHVIGTLTIPHVVDIYSGQYCCVIENHAGPSPRRCANLYVQGTYASFKYCTYVIPAV